MSNSNGTHSPADVIAAHLIAGGYATITSGVWPVYVNTIPSAVAGQAISINDTGGVPPQPYFDGTIHEYPGIQIRVRGNPHDQTGPRTKIVEIRKHLSQIYRVSVSYDSAAYILHAMKSSSGIIPLPQDAQARWDWTTNFTVTVTQSSP